MWHAHTCNKKGTKGAYSYDGLLADDLLSLHETFIAIWTILVNLKSVAKADRRSTESMKSANGISTSS